MFKLYSILSFMALFFFASHSYGKIIVVNSLNDDSFGETFRHASTLAVSNDTILINVKGTITLTNPITFSSISNLTIIGPYAKHNTFEASGSWTGSFFTFTECTTITLKKLGFGQGNFSNRHIAFIGGSNHIIERCVFQNNEVTSPSFSGAAILFDSSDGIVKSCSFINNKCTKGTFFSKGTSQVTIENCTFSNNIATDKAAAIFATGTVEIELLYNTFVQNNALGGIPEVILISGNGSLKLENNAIGYNNASRQIQRSGSATISSNGGNIIKLNYFSESTGIMTLYTGDSFSMGADFGLRSTIKTDGFGLKYWPIVESSSDLINPAEKTEFTPVVDCRNAPRCLKGPSSSSEVEPDAGACEYTHLRVTNNSGIASEINSFLWALESEQRKDSIHYIEFDIPDSPAEIVFIDAAIISDNSYLIDGFSQDGSAISGPHQIGFSGVTSAKIGISFKDGNANYVGIRFNSESDNSVLQGVRIISFERHGIAIDSPKISIFGCEIGIDSLGDSFENKRTGIIIRDDSTKIGGWEHWQRNVISGNGQGDGEIRRSNIYLQSGTHTEIQGNIIGGASNGVDTITDPLRTRSGIHSITNNSIIGGTLINSGNYILSNKHGIQMKHTSNNNIIQGNNIGVGWDTYTALENSIAGILLAGSDNNLIGGENTLMSNHIAFNLTGIALAEETNPALNNRILGNSIHSNTQQGIDLENDNLVAVNDTTVHLSQQNSGLDYPVLISSENCTGPTTLTEYELFVPFGEEYRVEFFSNTSPDATNGEGETFLGFQNVTPSSTPEIFTYDHGIVLLNGTHLSATVTRISTMTTSEFGTNVDVGSIFLDASFSYDPICPGESAAPIYDVHPGGTFRFSDPAPLDGVDLDLLTGVISTPVEGATYSIIYSVGGACSIEDTTTVTIITVDETFSFPDICAAPFSPLPIMDGDTGTFSFFPIPVDGATINSETGLISNPVEYANYTVIHALTHLGCTQSDTAIVSVLGIEESFEFEDVCFGTTGFPSAIMTTEGDTFSIVSPPDTDVSIDPITGELSNGVLGTTYIVRHVVQIDDCRDSMDVEVMIIEANSSFTFSNFCPGLDSPSPAHETEGGIYSFSTVPSFDETIDPTTGVISFSEEGEEYAIIYTVEEGICINSDTILVSVLTVDEGFTFDDFCWSDSESPSATDFTFGGEFYFGTLPDDGADIIGETGVILSPVEFTIYEVVHTLTNGLCTQTDTVFVTAIGVDESFIFPDFCPGTDGIPTSIETSGGEFEFEVDPDGTILLNTTSGMIAGAIEGDNFVLKYTVSDITGTCTQSSIETIDVISIDESFSFDNFCAEFSGLPSDFDLSDEGSFLFAPDLGDAANIDPTTGEITTAVPGTTYTIEYTVGVCAERDTVTVIALASDIADFTLNDYCSNMPQAAEILGTLEGSFDFFPLPTDDAIINLSNGTITNSTGGIYTVRYLTTGSSTTCADTILKTVTLFETPSISLYSEVDLYCPNDELMYIVATDISITEKVYWYLETTESEILDSIFSFLPEFLSIGENIFYAQAKSTDGCFGNPEKYTLTLSDTTGMHAIPDPFICMGSPVYLAAYGGVFYEWYTDIPLSDYNSSTQSAFSLNEEDYIVSIKNEDNCEVLDTVHVRFLPRQECEINVYNAFSPNGDGKNDFWYIENLINYLPNTVYIYNRWGDEVNRMNNYDNLNVFWDGTDKQGKALPPNTYFYVVISDDSESNQAGWLQLVR